MTNLTIILRFVALGLMIFILATIPLRKKKIDKKLGKCILSLDRKNSILFIAVLLFAPLLVILQWIREFAPYINIVLSTIAVLGYELVIREHIYTARSGVYEDALVVDGRLIEKTNIVALPTLEYENNPEAFADDSMANDPAYKKALKIVTQNNGVIFVGFENEEQRNNTVELIRKWVNQ